MRVTLCGSAKFEQSFKEWNKRLTLEGHAVYSLACYPSDFGGKNWYTDHQKTVLDKVHKMKIDNSDAIFVINTVNRYIGDSTSGEIDHAFNTRKIIYWEYWPTDEQIHRWYPFGNSAYDPRASLFRGVCSYSYCQRWLEGAPCAVCYE